MPGFMELLPIIVIAIIFFGSKKLPEAGRALAKGIRAFKKATTEPLEVEEENKEKELEKQSDKG